MGGIPATDGRRKKAIRLRAWAWVLTRGADKKARYEESYPCNELCRGEVPRRAALRCALPDFHEHRWKPSSKALPVFMGGAERESTEDGCPGAWYRCEFACSIGRYERALSEHGFSSNKHLDACEDRLVIDAIQYYEQEQLQRTAKESQL